MRKFWIIIFAQLSVINGFAQYAPAAGKPGSTAIHVDSSAFVSWAATCTVTRGYMNASDPPAGMATAGEEINGTGKAGVNPIVSLGDGGSALLTFTKPIYDGPGYDFAVFENSFSDTYLELAFVEVSSDGVNFFRFASGSLTQDSIQVGPFDTISPEKINNLAGKYRGGYGTPFDIAELSSIPGLDVNMISYIKITDVVGSIDPVYGSKDVNGNFINDPFPTPFPSSGFDLDAVGVINQNPSFQAEKEPQLVAINSNWLIRGEPLIITSLKKLLDITLYDLNGRKLQVFNSDSPIIYDTITLSPGIYFINVKGNDENFTKKLVIAN